MKISKARLKKIILEELQEAEKAKVSKAGQERVSKKIGYLRGKEDKPADQAAAIAYSMEDRGELEEVREPVMEETDFDVGSVMSSLNKTMKELADGMKQLDLSIDYLSSIFIGMDPFEVGVQQRAFGRLAAPTAAKKEAK